MTPFSTFVLALRHFSGWAVALGGFVGGLTYILQPTPLRIYLPVLVAVQGTVLAIVVSVALLSISASDYTNITAKIYNEKGFLTNIFVIFGISIFLDLVVLLALQYYSNPADISGLTFAWRQWLEPVTVAIVISFAAAGFLYLVKIKDQTLSFLGSPQTMLEHLEELVSLGNYRKGNYTANHKNPARNIAEIAQDYIERDDVVVANAAISTLETASKNLLEDLHDYQDKDHLSRWKFILRWKLFQLRTRIDPRQRSSDNSDESTTDLLILILLIILFGELSNHQDEVGGFEDLFGYWTNISKMAVKTDASAEIVQSIKEAEVKIVQRALEIGFEEIAENALTPFHSLCEMALKIDVQVQPWNGYSDILIKSIERGKNRSAKVTIQNMYRLARSGVIGKQGDKETTKQLISDLGKGWRKMIAEVEDPHEFFFSDQYFETHFAEYGELCIKEDMIDTKVGAMHWGKELAQVGESAIQGGKDIEAIRVSRLLVEMYIHSDGHFDLGPRILGAFEHIGGREEVKQALDIYRNSSSNNTSSGFNINSIDIQLGNSNQLVIRSNTNDTPPLISMFYKENSGLFDELEKSIDEARGSIQESEKDHPFKSFDHYDVLDLVDNLSQH